MKSEQIRTPDFKRVIAEADCPYCGHTCTYDFTAGNEFVGADFDHDVCDHCVEYGVQEFIFQKEVNGLQKLQEIKDERRQDNKKN